MSQNLPKFAITQIQDVYTRQNFQILQSYFDTIGVNSDLTTTSVQSLTTATTIATRKLITAKRYPIVVTDRELFVDCSQGSVNLILPGTTAFGDNDLYVQKVDSTSNTMTITVSNLATEVIRAATSVATSTQWDSILLRRLNLTWYY